MKINFIGHEWEMCCSKESNFTNLPVTPAIYVLVVKAPVFKGKKIVYIGNTKDLRKRMSTHKILSILRINKSGYEIEILYKNFGNNVNSLIESQLIKKHLPPYNCSLKACPKYSMWDFWLELGIYFIKWRKKDYNDPIDVKEAREYLLAKKKVLQEL